MDGAAVLCAGTLCPWGVVARSGRVVGSCNGGVGVVLGLVVVGLMVVVVLWVCPQGAMAFRWGVGARHQLQPLGLHGLVHSGDGSGAGLDGDRGRGLRPPRIGLAGGSDSF